MASVPITRVTTESTLICLSLRESRGHKTILNARSLSALNIPGATQREFALSRPETFTMYIRIPEWAGAHTMVSANGRAAGDSIEPGKFLALKREWKDHDRIELEIDMPLRLESIE